MDASKAFKKSRTTIYEAMNRTGFVGDFFIRMTDAQRHLFANKMSEMPEMLQDKERFEELLPYLRKVGFNTK